MSVDEIRALQQWAKEAEQAATQREAEASELRTRLAASEAVEAFRRSPGKDVLGG